MLLAQKGHFPGNKFLYPRVLETDGVNQPSRRLDEAGTGIARPRGESNALDHDGAEHTKIEKLAKLSGVAAGAGGCDEGAAQGKAGQGGSEGVYLFHAKSTSSAQSTGPSVQMCQ